MQNESQRSHASYDDHRPPTGPGGDPSAGSDDGNGPPGGGGPPGRGRRSDRSRSNSRSRRNREVGGNAPGAPGDDPGDGSGNARDQENDESKPDLTKMNVRVWQSPFYGDEEFNRLQLQDGFSRGIVDEVYLLRVQERYRKLIETHLGNIVTTNHEGVKFNVIKVSDIDRWDGNPDIDRFEEFLTQFCRWCKVNHLGGPYRPQEIIAHLGLHLIGAPQKWFSNHIDGTTATRIWTLLGVVMGLYRQYVHDTAIQQATDKFNAIRGGKTVYDLYQKLKTRAENMTEKPDSLTFKMRFLSALSSEIRDYVFYHNHSAERSSMSELFHSAQARETALFNQLRYRNLSVGRQDDGMRRKSGMVGQSGNSMRTRENPQENSRQQFRSQSFSRSRTQGPRVRFTPTSVNQRDSSQPPSQESQNRSQRGSYD